MRTPALALCIVVPTLAFAAPLDPGEKVKGAWLWARSVRAVPGEPGRSIFTTKSSTALEGRKRAFATLAGRGVPTFEILEVGTVGGAPAALVSGSPHSVSVDAKARFDALRASSLADLDAIEKRSAKLPVTVVSLAITPEGHVVVADARAEMPESADVKRVARALAKLRDDARVAELYRETLAAGEDDRASALDSARYLAGELHDLETRGVTGALDGGVASLWKNAHLGSIDPSKLPTTADVYRRGSFGLAREVRVRELPAIDVAPGKTAKPLLYGSSMAIDSDGAGTAHEKDDSGQATTSLTYADGRSLDPTKIPYTVLPLGFAKAHPGVRLGDVVAVFHAGKVAYAIYGDEGPVGQIGEGSIALAKALGIDADPNEGGVPTGVSYIVFPGSGSGAPLSPSEIATRGEKLLAAAGGAP